MGSLLDLVKNVKIVPVELIHCEKSELCEENLNRQWVSSHNSPNSQPIQPMRRQGWNKFMQSGSLEARHILDLIRQAYPSGVPAQVPIETCHLCGWRYPAVLCRFRNGSEGYLCVGCVVAESRPNVNRSECEICGQGIEGAHSRTDPGGPVVCSGCRLKLKSSTRP